MIVVTGANGQLGRAIVENLLRRIPADHVVASVRDAENASGLTTQGVEVRVGDFARADSIEEAFAGADQILIVSADKLGDEALHLDRTAINVARNAGVARILYTSHMGAVTGSPFLPADQHAGTEAQLAASGIAFTALRHGFYAESCLQMFGDDLRAGKLRTPESGAISWTARADLAEADAAILASEGIYDGITPPLTASSAITMGELASIASEVFGCDVDYISPSIFEGKFGHR